MSEPIETSKQRSPAKLLRRARIWAAQTGLGRRLVFLLFAIAVIAGVFSFLVLSENIGTGVSEELVWWVLVSDLALVLTLAGVITWGLVRLWARRRTGAAGAQLHVRLVALFAVLTVAPAIVVAGLAAGFFNAEMRSWFSESVQTTVENSKLISAVYLQEHLEVIKADALMTKIDLENRWLLIRRNPRMIEDLLNAEVQNRRLTAMIVFDEQGRIIASSGITSTIMFSQIPPEVLEMANADRVALIDVPNDRIARVRGLVRLRTVPRTYLYVDRLIDRDVMNFLRQSEQAAAQYEELQEERLGIEFTLVGLFVLVTGLLLLSAVGIGLAFANRLAAPLGRLVEAAEQVRQGNLSVRLGADVAEGEFGTLARAFNRMTRQLDEQHGELISANRELEERRRFTEAILSGVTAGVIGLDAEGRVNLPNRSAGALLGLKLDEMQGNPLAQIVPEVADLLARARRDPQRLVEGEIQVEQPAGVHTFLVRIAADQSDEGQIEGFVATFDDMSELVQAQRTAAWADVARRIAHEIKNPLTPIQLSAERLKRKYLKQISDDPDTFVQCTDTIVRQVGDIGRMVDEFSSFARMPAPKMVLSDLVSICRDAVFLQRNAHPGIKINHDLPTEKCAIGCDEHLVSQAVTNLLQNAADAITGAQVKNIDKTGGGRIDLTLKSGSGYVLIEVLDDGPGLPTKVRDRLTEPYVTTRAEGTGLGLAIVNKIMEDHGGELRLSDRDDGKTGARVELIFDAHANTSLKAKAG